MRYYIFRNNTLEPLFGNLDACYSGYGDISSLEEGADRYIWFYQVPFGFDRCRVAEEVLSYIDKLRWVIEKIPAHKSVLVFSLVDLCPFQWAGSEWEVQESIETYNKYLRSLASERSNVRYVYGKVAERLVRHRPRSPRFRARGAVRGKGAEYRCR